MGSAGSRYSKTPCGVGEECEDCPYEIELTIGAALISTAVAYADAFSDAGPKGLVIFQYLQDSFLCFALLILNVLLVILVLWTEQVNDCLLEFGLQLVGMVFLISTLTALNQKGSQLLPSLDMMLLTDSSFVSGFLHVVTLASQREEEVIKYRNRAMNPNKRPLRFMYDINSLDKQLKTSGGLLSFQTFVRASAAVRAVRAIQKHAVELSSAFRRMSHFMVTMPITQGFADPRDAKRLSRKATLMANRGQDKDRISQAKKLSLGEWCMGVVISPVTLAIEVVQHGAAIIFYAIGLLVHFPRFLAGSMTWIGIAVYVWIFGGQRSYRVCMRHQHWDEQIELDTEIENGLQNLAWEVTVLLNDRGNELRIAEDSKHFVSLGANLWKENGVDTDQTEAQKFALPFLEHIPLSAYFPSQYNDAEENV